MLDLNTLYSTWFIFLTDYFLLYEYLKKCRTTGSSQPMYLDLKSFANHIAIRYFFFQQKEIKSHTCTFYIIMKYA